MNNFTMGLSIVSILVIIFTIVVLVYIGGKYFLFELPALQNAEAQQTASEFFRGMVDKSYDNPDQVFYYFETSDNLYARGYTDSKGKLITENMEGGASYVSKSCPPDKIASSLTNDTLTSLKAFSKDFTTSAIFGEVTLNNSELLTGSYIF